MRHCAQNGLSIVGDSSSSVPVTCSVTVGSFFGLAQREEIVSSVGTVRKQAPYY